MVSSNKKPRRSFDTKIKLLSIKLILKSELMESNKLKIDQEECRVLIHILFFIIVLLLFLNTKLANLKI